MKKIENNIASNIKYYRKLANLTQEQLANFLNGKKVWLAIMKMNIPHLTS